MNTGHLPHPQIDEPDHTNITIDFDHPSINEANQAAVPEIHEEFRSTRDVIANPNTNRRVRRGKCCKYTRIFLLRSLMCVSRMIKFICTRKVYFFVFFFMISMFLRMGNLFSDKIIFWTTYFPMIIIVIAGIFKLCIVAQRAREEFETSTAQRRTFFNERLLRQIVMHDIQNRLQVAVAMDPRRTGFHNIHASMQAIQNQRAIIRQILFELGALEDAGFFAQRQNVPPPQQGLSDEDIQELPLEAYENKGEQETCSICIDEFEHGINLRVLPCSHRYHPKCIDDWLKIQNTCPNCKAEIPRREGRNVAHPNNVFNFNFRPEEDF